MDIQLIKKEFVQFSKFFKEKNFKLAILSLEKILKENQTMKMKRISITRCNPGSYTRKA